MYSQTTKEVFLQLVCLGIGHHCDVSSQEVDWQEIKALATEQGLSAIVLDGLEVLRTRGITIAVPEKKFLTQWIGEVLQIYEYRYELVRRAIAELAGFYSSHGFKMMVLKGYACSLDWPKPEHRPSGDIDIWQFGRQKEADSVLAKEKRIKIDKSHHHHTVFEWRDFMVENHYDFINVHHHKSHVELEKILKELGKDDSHFVEEFKERVYLPSPNLHALFLLKHMMLHFASDQISLRQLLDWGFFVIAHGVEIDWEWLESVLDKFGMRPAYDCFNRLLTEQLGFDFKAFSMSPTYMNVDNSLNERVLNDILSPQYSGVSSSGKIQQLLFRLRRWLRNGWKHRLCYKESMLSALWSGIWNHVLMPDI